MKAAMQALGYDSDALTVQVTQLVKLLRAGEEVKLSKRQGDIIELRSIIEEIGADATRFMYLLQSVDSKQTFDLELAASQAMDNPVYYVQMAYARLCSIERNANEHGFDFEILPIDQLSVLGHQREMEIIRGLEILPEAIDLAARELAPHKIVTWVRDFANSVHGFHHDCYVIGDGISEELTNARLNLVVASRQGLKVGLDLLGVSAPNKNVGLAMAERISRALLPDNTSVADDGMAMFGGVRVDDLVTQFGTPLFVYDEDHIRKRCQEAVKAFPDGVSYASKAFLCKAIAKLVHEEGMGLDVATIGEAYIALQSGVPASDLTLHGNNKSMEELRYAADNGIGKVVIDSFDEIDRIEHLYATTKTDQGFGSGYTRC